MKYNSEERFPLVDETGEIIGSATRAECHDGSKKLHPVVHLHVVTPKGDILLQKRSMSKDIQPGKWDTAVGGHVDFGETITDALLRESREELGIDASDARPLTTYVFESEVEKEFVSTFYLPVNPDSLKVTAAEDEVDETRFWSRDEIENSIGRGILTPNFEMEYRRILPALRECL